MMGPDIYHLEDLEVDGRILL